MAENIPENAQSSLKLVLDEATGEWVSRNELRKRIQKRARKSARTTIPKNIDGDKDKKAAKDTTLRPQNIIDHDAMFKHGFLADVFSERPVKPVVTRFPPESNGFLHLGHAKILRFDDTNPDEEDEIYFEWILKTVRWLGFEPDAVTHSSDYFQVLYEQAQTLIKLGKAYVCHCTEADIKLQRGGQDGKEGPRFRCRHAEQNVQTNLNKFQAMKDGEYEPQAAFLRMKQNLDSDNPQMWDLAAYRIPKKQKAHSRAPEWKIFPTYDFTHCLCDSFEKITHSLCTTEFIQSRESYEWLNSSLGVYEPMQREFGRLNITKTVMSKRALKQLVETGTVDGWDDPRLFTLIAMKRRGIPPAAILSFINELGVTTSRSIIQITRFEQSVRKYLEMTVPRLMLVLDPIPLTIEDLEEPLELDIPFFPKDASFGSRKAYLTRTIFIDRSDFRTSDGNDYYRLAPGKAVGLLHAPFSVRAVSFVVDEVNGLVVSIQAVLDPEGKPKAHIQWVPQDAMKVQVRIYSSLFESDDPMSVDGGFLSDINPQSKVIHNHALLEEGFHEVRNRGPWPAAAGDLEIEYGPEDIRFQALRVGYFAVDSESSEQGLILNRIVSLKEDAGKSVDKSQA